MTRISRRTALLLPFALAGCDTLDGLFDVDKPPLPGKRISVLSTRRGIEVDAGDRPIALPRPVNNPEWAQAGGDPSHAMGHLQAGDRLTEVWRADIGEPGGYRDRIFSPPVVAGGRVFTMDADAGVAAFDAKSGNRLWQRDTQAKKDRSVNVGGGIGVAGGVVYVSTGRADVLALAADSGKIIWRQPLGNAARAAPTIADGRLFVPTVDQQLVALAIDDGRKLWAYQGEAVDTFALGLPSPAYADGIVVAGFGAGEVAALRAEGGAVAWTDTLASTGGRNSLVDISTVRAMPVISDGTVYATGLGGLTVAVDLRTGRRLWERDIGSAETPWLAGDWLFVLTDQQELAAVSRTDGAIAWVTPLPRYGREEKKKDPIRWQGPLLVGDRLVLTGSRALAVAISPYTGKVLGRQELPGASSLPAIVAGGTVFIITDDAVLLALR